MDFKNFLIKSVLVFFLVIVGMVGISFLVEHLYAKNNVADAFVPPFYDDGVCNVAVVPLYGTVGIKAGQMFPGQDGESTEGNYGGDIDRLIADMDYAKSNPYIKGVILQVDSSGGYGAGAETFLEYLRHYDKPVVAQVRDIAASAAYWAILGADHIIAQPSSEVGSIGVTMSYLQNTEKNKKDGLSYVSLSSGKFKDTGTADKELSDDEEKYLQEKIKKFADIFKSDVVLYRKLSQEKVDEIADGRTFVARDALGYGLIDEIGFEKDALSWLSTKISQTEGFSTAVSPCYPTKL